MDIVELMEIKHKNRYTIVVRFTNTDGVFIARAGNTGYEFKNKLKQTRICVDSLISCFNLLRMQNDSVTFPTLSEFKQPQPLNAVYNEIRIEKLNVQI